MVLDSLNTTSKCHKTISSCCAQCPLLLKNEWKLRFTSGHVTKFAEYETGIV